MKVRVVDSDPIEYGFNHFVDPDPQGNKKKKMKKRSARFFNLNFENWNSINGSNQNKFNY
jgi:hypothetical protein